MSRKAHFLFAIRFVFLNNSEIPIKINNPPKILRVISPPNTSAKSIPIIAPIMPNTAIFKVGFHLICFFMEYIIIDKIPIGMKNKRFMPCAVNCLVSVKRAR